MGSPIRFIVATDAGELAQWGEVLVVDAPARLAYTLFAPRDGLEDAPENRFTMRYELEAVEGATALAILQEDPRPGAADRSDDESPVLAGLRDLAESLA